MTHSVPTSCVTWWKIQPALPSSKNLYFYQMWVEILSIWFSLESQRSFRFAMTSPKWILVDVLRLVKARNIAQNFESFIWVTCHSCSLAVLSSLIEDLFFYTYQDCECTSSCLLIRPSGPTHRLLPKLRHHSITFDFAEQSMTPQPLFNSMAFVQILLALSQRWKVLIFVLVILAQVPFI